MQPFVSSSNLFYLSSIISFSIHFLNVNFSNTCRILQIFSDLSLKPNLDVQTVLTPEAITSCSGKAKGPGSTWTCICARMSRLDSNIQPSFYVLSYVFRVNGRCARRRVLNDIKKMLKSADSLKDYAAFNCSSIS